MSLIVHVLQDPVAECNYNIYVILFDYLIESALHHNASSYQPFNFMNIS
jgi:hypothetical protein